MADTWIHFTFRITWSYCIRLSFLLRLLFGSFSNDFRHFTLSLTVLLYLFWHSLPESGLTTLKDTAIPVIIDNDAGIRQTTNVKNSKPCILGYINDKLNEITSVHGPDTQIGVLEQPGVKGQLLFRAQI
jgi:hypothetical protein